MNDARSNRRSFLTASLAGGKYAIDIYDAIERMMPYAKRVSARSKLLESLRGS